MYSRAFDTQSRRARRLTVGLFAIAVAFAACSSDGDPTDTSDTGSIGTGSIGTSSTVTSSTDAAAGTAPAADSVPATTADPAAFPVTFDTMFGETVIEALPERVVSVGYTEGDQILALGVTPVAIRDWYGDQPGALWPWAAESAAAQAGPIEVLPAAEINFEQVAALDPDVIFGIGSGMEQDDYDRLSVIAPVVAQSDDYNVFGTPWDVVQLMIGRALGLEPEAQALVDDVNAMYAAAVEADPAWQDMTGTVSAVGEDGTIGVFTDGDNRGHMLTQLGFALPAEIIEIAGDSFYAQISAEQMSLLDNDVLVYIVPTAERERFETLPLFQALSAVQDGRTVFVDETLAGAMGFASTLSIPYALEALVPQIQSALGE